MKRQYSDGDDLKSTMLSRMDMIRCASVSPQFTTNIHSYCKNEKMGGENLKKKGEMVILKSPLLDGRIAVWLASFKGDWNWA